MEILVIDGGSSDDTIAVAASFGARTIHNPDVLAEPAVALGLLEARYRVKIVLACDNRLADDLWISRLLLLIGQTDARCVFTHVLADSATSPISRYWSLAQTDPFSYFVYGPACDPRRFHEVFPCLFDETDYACFKFVGLRPLLALAQGTVIVGEPPRRRTEMERFDDVAPIWGLIDESQRFVYFRTGPIYHDTVTSFREFVAKYRRRSMSAANPAGFGFMARWNILPTSQRRRSLVWPFYAASIIGPVAEAVRRYRLDHDVAWFLHPVVNLILLSFSVEALLRHRFRRWIHSSSQPGG